MSTLAEYNKEIVPMFRQLNELKQQLKEFKLNDEKSLEFADEVKGVHDAWVQYLESTEEGGKLLSQIHALQEDIKQAVASAKGKTPFKKAELKTFFAARAKEKGVEKVITKGELFGLIDHQLQ